MNQRAVDIGIVGSAYGVNIQDPSDFKDPFAYNDYDLWFGEDFDFFIDELLEDVLADLEDEIESVRSSNISEQRSQQSSAQSSADREVRIALGLADSDSTSRNRSTSW